MSKYEVRGVKMHKGHEGEPLAECGLYRDGVKVAIYSDGDWGGEAQFWWMDEKAPKVEVKGIQYGGEALSYMGTPEEALLAAHCAVIPPEPCDFGDHKPVYTTPDIFVSDLVAEYDNAKRFAKICQTKTMFRVKGQPKGEYKVLNAPYTPAVKAELETKYGTDLVEILNKEFISDGDAEALKRKQAESKMRKQCQTATLFRLQGDELGRYWVSKIPYNPIVKTQLQAKYGAKLVEIINETLAA